MKISSQKLAQSKKGKNNKKTRKTPKIQQNSNKNIKQNKMQLKTKISNINHR